MVGIADLDDPRMLDCSGFPCSQLNFGWTPWQALSKLGHWLRQNVVDWSGEAVGLLQFHPSIAILDARMKTETGRGGQLNHHNVSYIGASWLTIENRAHDSGLLQLSPEELATALFWELPSGITQLFNLLHSNCYQALPSTLLNRHVRIPSGLVIAFPCAAAALGDNCEELEEPRPTQAIADEIDDGEPEPHHPCIYLSPGIDAHLTLRRNRWGRR